MRLCFIVEDQYRNNSMPLAVVSKLTQWGHEVDILEPGRSTTRVSELIGESSHDAWILKTVSGGPGLSLLEAAGVAGLTTINDVTAIRCVRDKAVAAAAARRHGLPFPLTYFAAVPELLDKIPAEHYPLVVKPACGFSGRSVHIVKTPEKLAEIRDKMAGEGFLIAQPYIANPGADIKVYCAGGELFATLQSSPLHPNSPVRGQMIPLAADLARLVTDVGAIFGLDIYGVDVVEGPDGWMVVDVNDFPSFHWVPNAPARVARSILRLAASSRRTPAVLSSGEGMGRAS
jgi:ribosomal protein S6--L-glutamate ligase